MQEVVPEPPLSAWARRRRYYCHVATLTGLAVGTTLVAADLYTAFSVHVLPALLGADAAATWAAPWSSPFLSLPLLERYLAFATLIEMTSNFETLWLRERARRLPYWSPKPLQPLADFLFARPALNDALVLTVVAGLVAIVAGYASQPIRVLNAAVFAVLSLVDLPRLMRLQQCMFSMCAFVFPTPVRSLELILGGVYLYSGASKLIMPVFYTDWADGVCAPIKTFVDAVTLRCLRLHNWPRLCRAVFYLLVAAAMAGETVMGLALLDASLFGRVCDPVWCHLVVGGIGVVALHVYIIVFVIALPTPKEPGILNWNVLCSVTAITITQLSLTTPVALGLTADASAWLTGLFSLPLGVADGMRVAEVVYHALVVCAFVVYPVSMYFGRAFAFEFTFSYFNGAMFGSAYGVYRRTPELVASFPERVRDRTLRRFQSISAAENPLCCGDRMTGSWWEGGSRVGAVTGLDSYGELLTLWESRGISLVRLADQMQLTPSPGSVSVAEARQLLLEQTIVLDCDWLCATHTSDIADPYRAASSCFLPAHFFACLARTALDTRDAATGKTLPAVYVRTGHEVWFGPWITQERIN